MGRGSESGPYHGLPERLDEARMFTLVRPAPEWYRSIWAYMMRMEWREGGTESPLWNYLTQMTVRCESDVFDEFVVNVYGSYPGLYTWMLESLAPPGVVRVRLSKAIDYLKNEVGVVSVDPSPIDIQRTPPHITKSVRNIIRDMDGDRYEPLVQKEPSDADNR